MYKNNNLKPFSYYSEKKKFESNAYIHRKNPSISPDKIYFFRTSLFTEKSKNFIIKLNSCEKNKQTFNSSNITDEVMTPKINTIIQPVKTSIKIKKGKFNFSQHKNANNSDVKENPNSSLKEKNDFSRNPIINKSSNDLINTNITNYISNLKKENKTMTMDKRESIHNEEKNKKENITIKNLKKMKKEKIFAPLNNIINTNNNKQIIMVNYLNQNHSIINIANANSKPKQLPKDKAPKIETTHKVKYRLKSKKGSSKKAESKNIISFGGIKNKNLQKEMKNLKAININYNMKSSSLFDENFYISKYKLGNYYAKKNNNNRYGNINNNFNAQNNVKNSVINNEKINSKRKNQNNLNKKSIFI